MCECSHAKTCFRLEMINKGDRPLIGPIFGSRTHPSTRNQTVGSVCGDAPRHEVGCGACPEDDICKSVPFVSSNESFDLFNKNYVQTKLTPFRYDTSSLLEGRTRFPSNYTRELTPPALST